ncbi:PucR family transcriptional regulator [Nonomuraea jiangxiensis]|uniref:PucR C-terminal helix-turn-helix domain-containing protein n=1 Tax=Nonomuraea jiangxiensis TaxID=633440 RepID=A0A1G9DIL4_9ACTN|nr:PucR family transcriptional regulator [Nonomuraea jiangxiensis]SDK63753.1 PucR C-terminal helix-turn-helix domain-containing protein [Nonomuraea jiangxiensis]
MNPVRGSGWAAPVTVAELVNAGPLAGARMYGTGERPVHQVRIVDRLSVFAAVAPHTAVVLIGAAASGGWAVEMAMRRAWEQAAACVIAPSSGLSEGSGEVLADRLGVTLLFVDEDPLILAVRVASAASRPEAARTQLVARCATRLADAGASARRVLGVLNAELPGTSVTLLDRYGRYLAGRQSVGGPAGDFTTAGRWAAEVEVLDQEGAVLGTLVAGGSSRSPGWPAVVRTVLGLAVAPLTAWAAQERLRVARDFALQSSLAERLLNEAAAEESEPGAAATGQATGPADLEAAGSGVAGPGVGGPRVGGSVEAGSAEVVTGPSAGERGGASTGGASTGGVFTGGTSTRGVATGGVSTGGVSTGGASMKSTSIGGASIAGADVGVVGLDDGGGGVDADGVGVDSVGGMDADRQGGVRVEAVALGWPVQGTMTGYHIRPVGPVGDAPLAQALITAAVGQVPVLPRSAGWAGWAALDPGRLAARVERCLQTMPWPCAGGVGAPVEGLPAVGESLLGAEAAAFVAGPGTVARADRMGPAELLGALPAGVLRAPAEVVLRPLLEIDKDGTLLGTLAAVLEEGGALKAAERLGVHRNTVTTRLERIKSAGFDLDDTATRLALQLACHVVLR